MTKLIYFGADWCSPCKRMKPVLEEFSAEHPEILLVKVDVDIDSESAIALNITSVPTTVVMKDNVEVARKRGAFSKQTLEKLVAGELVE